LYWCTFLTESIVVSVYQFNIDTSGVYNRYVHIISVHVFISLLSDRCQDHNT